MKATTIKVVVTYRGVVPKGMKTLALRWLRATPASVRSSCGLSLDRVSVKELPRKRKAKGTT